MRENTQSDIKIASLAAGFTLGFGFLTVWEVIKQTRRNRNPIRSIYIYMIWGEVLANFAIGIIGWLLLGGVIGPSIPVLIMILVLWTFELQLLMQIIINRIRLLAQHQTEVKALKWGTAIIVTLINIAVFCIWVPAHTNPPASQRYVQINEYWDRTEKILCCVIDAGLNITFLRAVQRRLIRQHGLVKYKPLVKFNAMLMAVSVLMDVLLIGTMSFPNELVYIQFHPVVYMVKLNIELTMANLIVKLARGATDNDMDLRWLSTTYDDNRASQIRSTFRNQRLSSPAMSATSAEKCERDAIGGKVHRRLDADIRHSVHRNGSQDDNTGEKRELKDSRSVAEDLKPIDDEIYLGDVVLGIQKNEV